MLKKSITYTDFNGNVVTDIFYFNLTRTELVKMQLSEGEGFDELLQRIVEAKNNGQIVSIFEQIILSAYGEKSVDGKSFDKEDDNGRPLSRKFSQTAAYDALFFEFVQNQTSAEEFIRGIMPAEIMTAPAASTQDQINEALAKQGIPAISADQFQAMPPPPPATV